jgi:hypothetical protein
MRGVREESKGKEEQNCITLGNSPQITGKGSIALSKYTESIVIIV